MQYKYIIRLLFIVLFFIMISSLMLYRYFMIENIILHRVKSENKRIIKLYQKNVWDYYQGAVHKINLYDDHMSLLNDNSFRELIGSTADFLLNVNVKISLYSVFGRKIATNNNRYIIENTNQIKNTNFFLEILQKIDAYFLHTILKSGGINKSFQGHSVISLITAANIVEDNDVSKVLVKKNSVFVHEYIPILNTVDENFEIQGIMEIYTDVTKEWNSIILLQNKILVSFSVIFLIAFFIIVSNTNYAQKIINQQTKINSIMEYEKEMLQKEGNSKSQFFANISHDLRTPLNSIIGFSELIISCNNNTNIDNLDLVAQKTLKLNLKYINNVHQAAKYLLNLINDILDLSKATTNNLKLEIIEVNVTKIINNCTKILMPKAQEKKLHITYDSAEQDIIVKADPIRLKQSILNILSNAVKFSRENETVVIKAAQNYQDNQVEIVISDKGIGIYEQDIPKALAPFGKVSNNLDNKYEGTGLGLSLTEQLIKLMGGELKIVSQVGIGTNVVITLRLAEIRES